MKTLLSNQTNKNNFYPHSFLLVALSMFLVSSLWTNFAYAQVPNTKLKTNSCGITLIKADDILYSDVISGATNYEYKVVNAGTGFNKTYLRGSGSNSFRLTWLTGISYNLTYDVQVRAQVGGSWGTFATICQVTTPTTVPATKLNTASCNITLTSMTQTLNCDAVLLASNFEYKIVNTSLGFNKTYLRNSSSTSFSISWVTGILYNTTYDIQVRAFAGGMWGSFTTVCQVTTPNNIPNTHLSIAFCNTTLSDVSDVVYCDAVSGATDYQYRVRNVSLGYDQTYTRGSSSNSFSLGWMTGIANNITYNVEVRAKAGGAWGNYGTICTLTTPDIALTQLNTASCGATLPDPTDVVYVDAVVGATNYQYHIYDTATAFDYTYLRNSSSNSFSLSWIPGIEHGITYKIEVKAKKGTSWGDYGQVCQLTAIPAGSMSAGICGGSVSLITDIMWAQNVPNATAYEYEVSNATFSYYNTYIRNSAYHTGIQMFAYNMMSGIKFNTTYDIRVRAKINNVWGYYGQVCQVRSAPFPQTQLNGNSCGAVLTSNNTTLYTAPVYGATNYEYTVSNTATGFLKVYVRNSSSSTFRISWIAGIQPSTTYDVKVKAYSGGVWGPVGPVCTVTTAATPRYAGTAESVIQAAELSVFPNPGTRDNIHVAFNARKTENGTAQINIYSLSGKLIFSELITAEEMGNYKIPSDAGIQTGTYLINVSTESETATQKFTVL